MFTWSEQEARLLMGIVFALSSSAMIVGAERKIIEFVAGLVMLLAGMMIASGLGLVRGTHPQTRAPRAPNVQEIVWQDATTLQFPPLTETGASWCVSSSKTREGGIFVSGNTYKVDADEKDVRVYLTFPDGEISVTAPIMSPRPDEDSSTADESKAGLVPAAEEE